MKWKTFSSAFQQQQQQQVGASSEKGKEESFMLIKFFIYIFILIQNFGFYWKVRKKEKKVELMKWKREN